MRRGVAFDGFRCVVATPLALARHLKCPIDSRYTGSAGSAIQVQPVQGCVGLEGGAGNRGVLPTGPRRPLGAFWRTAVVLARSRWWWRNPYRPEPDALAGCRSGLRTGFIGRSRRVRESAPPHWGSRSRWRSAPPLALEARCSASPMAARTTHAIDSRDCRWRRSYRPPRVAVPVALTMPSSVGIPAGLRRPVRHSVASSRPTISQQTFLRATLLQTKESARHPWDLEWRADGGEH
jgi:hypothetical protein